MTVTLGITTVFASISGLTISGVTVKDLDEIPASISQRDTPIMFPDPESPVTTFVGERASFSGGPSEQLNVTYDTNWVILASECGAGRNKTLEEIAALYTAASNAFAAVEGAAAITGAVDWHCTIGDPFIYVIGGVSFNAIKFVVSITELIN